MEEVFNAPPFEVFGLDTSWQGPRWAAGLRDRSGQVERIELGHGSDLFEPGAPVVRVVTQRSTMPPQVSLLFAAQELAHTLWHEGAEHSSALRAPFRAADPTEGWAELLLPVGATRVVFRSLEAGEAWVALAVVADRTIVSVTARNVEPDVVRLARIDDLTTYLTDRGLLRTYGTV